MPQTKMEIETEDKDGDDVGHESTQRLQTLQTATAMNLSHCQSSKSGRMAEAAAAAAAQQQRQWQRL